MTPDQFSTQMNRLAETFGKGAYSQERARLIWRSVQDFGVDWFERVVDEFVGSCRYAPLMPEFAEKISLEREKRWGLEKRQNERDAKDFMRSMYDQGEIKTICDTIRARMRGGIDDETFSIFVKMITPPVRT